ncbi:MAG: HNH endonuclease [Fusobacteriaceae bacterium]
MKEFAKGYFVTEDGRVFKEMAVQKSKQGYNMIKVYDKWYRIARTMLIAYKGYEENKECDHINKIRDDDTLDNLRWVTKSENLLNRHKTDWRENLGIFLKKETLYDVLDINEVKIGQGSCRTLMEEFNITRSHFYKIAKTGELSSVKNIYLVRCND